MKREYFGMLFIILSVILLLTMEYIFGEKVVMNNLYTFIVVWLMIAFQLGQYSMRYPKAF